VKVLVACEFSGVVRDAFRALGHEAYSCDILPCADTESAYHYQGDVREYLEGYDWDLMIAHPPCTYLSNSGAKHLYIDGKKEDGRYEPRWEQQAEAVDFVQLLMDAPIPRIAIENPVGALSRAIRKPDQIVQPWWFGDEATKTTCLWLKGLPLLVADRIVGRGERHVTKSGRSLPTWYNLPPSDDRGLLRSITFPGFARAMAEQWGGDVRR
jgi:hypothetical protein